MAINFDTSGLPPRGTVGWHELFDAVKVALPGDENQWVEFKANVDPSTKAGAATIAKSIVAFANRDPDNAANWLGGHAVILVGLEPGNVVGAPEIDPADLHNKVNALLGPPPPKWDATPVTYEGKHVIAITVDPPRQGDPIAVIGKSSGEVVDGHVYVRQVGKSERATSADIRRLVIRGQAADRSIGGITVAPSTPVAEIPTVAFPHIGSRTGSTWRRSFCSLP